MFILFLLELQLIIIFSTDESFDDFTINYGFFKNISTKVEITTCNVKCVACSGKPREDYHDSSSGSAVQTVLARCFGFKDHKLTVSRSRRQLFCFLKLKKLEKPTKGQQLSTEQQSRKVSN